VEEEAKIRAATRSPGVAQINHARQTTPPSVGTSGASFGAALQLLLDRAAITDLSALYSLARDSNDIEGVLACFAPDGAFVFDGMPTRGHAALRAFYVGNMDRYRTTLHVTHAHVIQLQDSSSGTGILTGHAELSFGETLMMTAYRYHDRYTRIDGRWTFAERALKFMYAVPFDEMATSFRDSLRLRWPDEQPRVAEIPESLPTWTTYQERSGSR
jgi:uncharacterized protein (TIGR02246 family)